MTGHQIMIDMLSREEQKLRVQLEEIRKRYRNPGNKGDQVVVTIREFLSRYLPPHNRLGHGEVFSIEGLRSKQTDLVITNEYHLALTDNWGEAQTFIIESVECAAEIKATITNVDTDLRDVFEKAKAFKQLFIEPEQGIEFRARDDDIPRFFWRKPFFGFAFESRVSVDRIVREIQSWENELRPVERPVLDSFFLLDRGGFMHMGNGKGRLVMQNKDGSPLTGYVKVGQQDGQVLTTLLLWIYSTMPKINYYTHPAFVYLGPSSPRSVLSLTDDVTLRRDHLPPGKHSNS